MGLAGVAKRGGLREPGRLRGSKGGSESMEADGA